MGAASSSEFDDWCKARNDTTGQEAVFDPRVYSAGASRTAHVGYFVDAFENKGKKIVVKEFKSSYANYKTDWKMDITITKKAQELASKFNEVSGTDRPIDFRDPIPLKVSRTFTSTTTKFGEWVVAEHFLYGDYTKWISNNGWHNKEKLGLSLSAFSHWTWVETRGQLMVTDIQGVRDRPRGYWLTDPAINSVKREYCKTNIESIGIHNFFDQHECTTICKCMGIDKKRPAQRDLRPSSLYKKSSSYSEEEDIKARRRYVPNLDAVPE